MDRRFGGVLIKARDTGRIFLMLRSTTVTTPLVWSLLSGGIDDGEEILEGLKREMYEETKINADIVDFEECGTSSRKLLELEIIKSISNTSIKSNSQFNSLFQMIWSKMMPEKREERTITFIDVITEYGNFL